jgi:hypothetical protein
LPGHSCATSMAGRSPRAERCLDEVFPGDRARYWRRVHGRVVEKGLPAHGVVRGPAKGREHVVLFWLRLPLSEDGDRVDRILCHDVAGPSEIDVRLASFTLYHCPPVQAQPVASSQRVRYG